MTIFLLHAFTAKKNYPTYRKKKLHDVAIVSDTRLPLKYKNYTMLPQRKHY